eukprot:jgi/Botrbrau1/8014/Bobra.384_2s0036.1
MIRTSLTALILFSHAFPLQAKARTVEHRTTSLLITSAALNEGNITVDYVHAHHILAASLLLARVVPSTVTHAVKREVVRKGASLPRRESLCLKIVQILPSEPKGPALWQFITDLPLMGARCYPLSLLESGTCLRDALAETLSSLLPKCASKLTIA